MKKHVLKLVSVIILTFVFGCASSQSKNTGEMVAEGGSKIKVTPDLAQITLTVEKTDSIEKNAIKNLNLGIDHLVTTLFKLGFTSKTIKISDYDITSSKYGDEEKTKQYTASNTLKLEFGLDTKLIDALYSEIQEVEISDLDISFDTKVSDSLEKKIRIFLVQQAIEDAKSNAINISKSLDVKLLRVKQVSKYKEGLMNQNMEINVIKFTPPKVVGDTQIIFKSSFGKFQVEDLEFEEKITLVYEISR